MDKRVFAVDFFDNALWDNIIAELGGSGICDTILCCEQYIPCEKVKVYLFSQRQWRVLLNTITPAEEAKLLEDLHERRVTNQSRLWVGSSQKKILCLSSNKDNKDKLEVFIMGHNKSGKRNYILDKKNFNLSNPLPGQTLKELIQKGLRKRIFEEVNMGNLSYFPLPTNKPAKSLISRAVNIKDKKHWLHYLSFAEKNIKEKYNAEQIVHCLDIHYKTFFLE